MKNIIVFLIICAICLGCTLGKNSDPSRSVEWEPWSSNAFKKARDGNKLVFVSLQASWDYTSYKMNKDVFSDPSLIDFTKKNFVSVRVEQSSHPGLVTRYGKDIPMILVFSPDGKEVLKKVGYLDADDVYSLLEAAMANKQSAQGFSQDVQVSGQTQISPELIAELSQQFIEKYDIDLGGWDKEKKYIHPYGIEYAMFLSKRGESISEKMVGQTLENGIQLIDDAWGGVYLYSNEDWITPNYAKLTEVQADYMRLYSLAHIVMEEKEYLRMPRKIENYYKTFLLNPNEALYTSQAGYIPGEITKDYFVLDEDERLDKGTPFIDKTIYTKENGKAINALAIAYGSSGSNKYLRIAKMLSEWIIENRSLKSGGFRHSGSDPDELFFADSLAMSEAFLSLYEVTGNREWLNRCIREFDFMEQTFKNPTGGYNTDNSSVLRTARSTDENINMTRFSNRLYYFTRNAKYKEASLHAMKYIVTPEVARKDFYGPGVLIANIEATVDPLHLIFIGAKDDKDAQRLFEKVWQFSHFHKVVEWWDPREENLPGLQVQLPKQSGIYVLRQGKLSRAAKDVDDLKKVVYETFK